MQALAIVQARMGSTRFPGKSLAMIGGRPILWYLFRQLAFCRLLTHRILATTDRPADDDLARYGTAEGWAVFRGSENDVLARYHDAARASGATDDAVIVRVTGDDIWPDPGLIDAALSIHASLSGAIDAVFTADDGNLPYGAYVESYTFRALARANREAREVFDREHVSPYIKRNRSAFARVEIAASRKLSIAPLSIDRPEDLDRNRKLMAVLERRRQPPFTLADILSAEPEIEHEP